MTPMPRSMAWVFLSGLVLTACGSLEEDLGVEPGERLPEHRPEVVYEELFPYYVELFAVSQYRNRDGSVGGVPGHAVMYLHGAARDQEASYPCLRLAAAEEVGEVGVGVSVNRWFTNVNWVAIPGRRFFLHGDVHYGDRITSAVFDETAREAVVAGLYDGIKLDDEYPTEGRRSLDDFVRQEALGTDFALTFARSLIGMRVPVTREQLEEMVVFLNDVNRQYAEGEAEYEWSGLRDNCAHLLHNALAAAGFWEPKTVGHFKSDLSLPANELLSLLGLVAEVPLDDPSELYRDQVLRDTLLAFEWLPRRHGALLTTIDAHPENEVFDPTFKLFVLESSEVHHEELLMRERYLYDLVENLEWFERHYEELLAERPVDAGEALKGDSERLFRRRYYAYLEEMLASVRAQLAHLKRSMGPTSGHNVPAAPL